MFGKNRFLARGKTLKELIATVWSQKDSELKIIYDADLPEDKFDFIVTDQPQWLDLLEAEINQRFHLVEQIENRNGTNVVVVKSVFLAEPPKLQFLAWQDEWQTNQPGAARHPDGSPVTDADELKWLKDIQSSGMDVSNWHLSPEPRFLKLWFSDSQFNLGSFSEVTLLDARNNVIPLGARGSMAGAAQDGNDRDGNLGWQIKTFSPGDGTNLPPHVIVRLRYAADPLEETQEVPVEPNHGISMNLKDGSILNGVGQNVDGNAFVAIAVHTRKPGTWRFGVAAVTKDGRELTTSPSESGFADGTGASVVEFTFEVPLADVSKFIIGTRPVRTVEFTHVVLPLN
jgi:hypothetical protein